MPRKIIVVDTETTGLDPVTDVAVEIAWHDLSTDETGEHIPPHYVGPDGLPVGADPEALRINRYAERLAGRPQDDGTLARDLGARLTDATFAGCNPTLDSGMLSTLLRALGAPNASPWHHRLLDVSAYAAGVLRIDPGELPSLSDLCEILGVPQPDHTAAGDVAATVACLRKLRDR